MCPQTIRSDGQQADEAETTDEVQAVLAWHDGDARASIRTLLADLKETREQLALAEIMMGKGFSRGWKPSAGKETSDACNPV